MSILKVQAIHEPDNDNEALTIDQSGNVTFSANVDMSAGTVTGIDTSNGDTAFSWGDHAQAGYLTTETYTGTLSNVVEDTSPQLGGNLDLNSSNITGTGNISITGNVTAGDVTVDNIVPSTQLSHRNLIINGGFDVWQRGTTVNGTSYSADRWMQWMTNAGVANRNVNCTKQTGGPIGRNSSYIRYAPQVVDTGMEKFAWGQKIEKSNLDHIESGQQLTLSFWIKREQSLPVDNNMDIQILYPDSTDNWSGGYLWRGDENIDQTLASISFNSLSTTWTKYSYTFVPSNAALDRGLAVYWHVGDTNFNLNNTNALISFTGVQLEAGSVATPFEHRSYGEELARCQRYYQISTNGIGGAGNDYGTMLSSYNSVDAYTQIRFHVVMRAVPTITMTSYTNVYYYSGASGRTITGLLGQNPSFYNFQMHLQGSGFTPGYVGHMDVAANQILWKADAEL